MYILLSQILKNKKTLSDLLQKVFYSKQSIAESILLLSLLFLTYFWIPISFVSFFVFALFIVKEAYLISDFRKNI